MKESNSDQFNNQSTPHNRKFACFANSNIFLGPSNNFDLRRVIVGSNFESRLTDREENKEIVQTLPIPCNLFYEQIVKCNWWILSSSLLYFGLHSKYYGYRPNVCKRDF